MQGMNARPLINFTHVILSMGIMFVCFNKAFCAPKDIWEGKNDSAPEIEMRIPTFAPIIKKLGKSVVNISIEGQEKLSNPFKGWGPFGGLPNGPGKSPLEKFFGDPNKNKDQIERRFFSMGSGFVIHSDGYIVTNYHVVQKAKKIDVRFKDQKEPYKAEVVGFDKKTDLALIKLIDVDKKFEAVSIGDSDSIEPGDWVIAIGNPFRLEHTATVGIVSAKSRKLLSGSPYDDYIQTDASINQGNSGGPLFNARGKVIGINTAIYSPNSLGRPGNIGIGFAIPINQAKDIISEIYKTGTVSRGWLGVLIQPVTPDVASYFGLKKAEGSLVADVMPDSPAKSAGFKRGDVILSFNGSPVIENNELPSLVARTKIGKEVNIGVMRDGKKINLKVKIGKLQDADQSKVDSLQIEKRLGLSVHTLTLEIAKALGLEDIEKGVVVADVEPGSIGERAGFIQGDIVLKMADTEIVDVESFFEVAQKLSVEKPVLVLILRKSNTLFLTLKIHKGGK